MIRWGILGCGDVTERKSGPAFNAVPESSLVAVMRRDAARAADYARRHHVPRAYDDAQRLIDDPEVDAVYIATPPGSHLDLALRVAAAGKPAYVEKPIARSAREASALCEAFERRGLPLFVAYYRRALDRFLRVKDAIDAGRIGRVASVLVTQSGPQQLQAPGSPLPWRLDPEQSGGGIFLDLACHTLDVLDFWLGPLLDVRGHAARTRDTGPEDRVVMEFTTAAGVLGVAHFDYANPVRDDRIVVHGTEGQLTLSTFGEDPVVLTTAAGETERFGAPHPPHIQQPLITAIVATLHGRGTCPSTGASAARTAAVMDRVLASFYAGRDDAFWTRPETWGKRSLMAER